MADDTRKRNRFRDYTFKCNDIPKLDANDPNIDKYIRNCKPVVIKKSKLVASALHWNLEYLEENIGDGDYVVYQSNSHNFKYWDDKKWTPDNSDTFMTRVYMKFAEFAERCEEWKPLDKRIYLQQTLNDTVGPNIVKDFLLFKWDWLSSVQKKNKWGDLTANLLLIGLGGNVTPCHYDEQENMYAQLHGLKRVILFPPEQFQNLYTHPVYHCMDRQSMVNFDNPDFERFPNFKKAVGFEAILEPGDVLYLPMYWFHHFESSMEEKYTVSVTFWYKAAPTEIVEYPLKAHQKVAMMRNLEKMISSALKDPLEIGPFMRNMVNGRFEDCNTEDDDAVIESKSHH